MNASYKSIELLQKDFSSFTDENEEVFEVIEELSDYQSLDLSESSILESIETVKSIVKHILAVKIEFGKYAGMSIKDICQSDSSYAQWLCHQLDGNMRNLLYIQKYF